MPAEIKWFVPEHLIHVGLDGGITPQETVEITQELTRMIDALNTKNLVHIILDTTNSNLQGSVAQFLSPTFKRDEQTGWVVVIGQSALAKFMCTLFAKTMQIQFWYVNTQAEALSFIRQRDLVIDAHLKQQESLIKPNPLES